MCLNKKENGILYNHNLYSDNADITKLGISVAKLIIETKDKERELKNESDTIYL